MTPKKLTGNVNIFGYTPYTDDVVADDVLFNIYADSRLALFGNDLFHSSTVALEGQLRNRGTLAIDGGLKLLNTAAFVNTGSVTQNGGDFIVGPTDDDVTTVRNLAGATWSLTNDADIRGSASSTFTNLGLLEQSDGASNIVANFFDRGGTIRVDGTLNFSAELNFFFGLQNRFVNDTIEGTGTVVLKGGIGYRGPVSQGVASLFDVLVGTSISTATAELDLVRTVGNVTLSSPTVVTGRLNLAAGSVLSLTNPSAAVYLGSEISGAGEIDLRGDQRVSTSSSAENYSTDLRGSVTFRNFGNSTFSGSPYGTIINTIPRKDEVITIENAQGATWTNIGIGSHFEQHSADGSSVFINNGIF